MKKLLSGIIIATGLGATTTAFGLDVIEQYICCTHASGAQCRAPTLAACATYCPDNCQSGGTNPPVGGDCDPCPIVGTSRWTDCIGICNYQQKLNGYIQNKITCTCTPYYSYRCKPRYYQTDLAVGMPPECALCPSHTDEISGNVILVGGGVNSAPGEAFAATDCYVIKNQNFEDDTGIYTFTDDCYYTE